MIAWLSAVRMSASGYNANCRALIRSNKLEVVAVNPGNGLKKLLDRQPLPRSRCITLAN